jgi:hypothetical protein
MQMVDTIIAGGEAAQGADCAAVAGGSWTSLGHNAEDIDPHPDGGCQSHFTGPADRTGLSLGLGALGDNGGPTDTILRAAISPVVDQGDLLRCPPDDQRGASRPQGARCDIGAVERTVPTSVSGFATTLTSTGAVLHGTANTRGLDGGAYFLYGPTASFGALTAGSPLAATGSAQPATASLTELLPATTYYFALVVSTPDGTDEGPVESFTTLPQHGPVITLGQPGPVTTTGQPGPVACRVPKLEDDLLAKAKRGLEAAHCALGKVTRAKRGHGKLVVAWQRFAPGTVHPAGFKVSLRLASKPAGGHRA